MARNALVVTLAAAAVGGCGLVHHDAVREVAARFIKAVVAGDGAAACRLLTDAGKRDMSAHPHRYSHSTGRTCMQVVAEIPRGPDIAAWRAMSHGRISVESRNTGLDTHHFWITYIAAGRTQRSSGGAGSTLLGKTLIEYPPFPRERRR